MKKYFYLLLAAALFVGCSEDDGDDVKDTGTEVPDGGQTQQSAEWDYTSCLGMNLMQALGKFGDTPFMDMGTMKMYQYETGKVESAMLIFNDNEQLYMVSASLKKDAVTIDELKAYFGSRYVLVSEIEETYTPDNEDEDETAGDVEEITSHSLSYVDNIEADQPTVTVNITIADASTTIIYMNPQMAPEEEEEPGTITMNAFALVDAFMGQNIADVLDEYEGLFTTVVGNFYGAAVTDDYVSMVGLVVTDGVVGQMRLFYDEVSDDETVAYYEENGYEIITLEPVVDEDSGESYPHYEFKNTEAGFTVDYVDGIATVSRL